MVDGDATFSESVSKHFLSLNFGVIRASSSEEATTCVKARSDIDVILLGLNMPTGIETLRRIRDLNPDAEVIVMADEFSTDDAIDVLKMGAGAYLWKPFNMNSLMAKVNNAVEKKHSQNFGFHNQS